MNLQEDRFHQIAHELEEQYGKKPPHRDVIWAYLNRQVTERSPYQTPWVYENMAAFRAEEGRESESLLRQARESELARMAADGWETVRIVADDSACPECEDQAGAVLTINEARAREPIPHPACSHTEHGQTFCRCRYAPEEHSGRAPASFARSLEIVEELEDRGSRGPAGARKPAEKRGCALVYLAVLMTGAFALWVYI